MMSDTDIDDAQDAQTAGEASTDAAPAPSPTTASEDKLPLKPLANSAAGGGAGEIDMNALLDVPVTLAVQIGKKRMPIQELISLTPGSIVELDRDLNSPLDLLVNGTLIARGEVVVMGKRFGLRLVDVVSPKERLQNLK